MRPRAAALACIAVLAGFSAWEAAQIAELTRSVNSLQTSVASLDARVATVTNTASSTAAQAAEIARREQVAQQSGPQALQDAVAKVTPAVVSIVESKEVPKLQVTYENPFGNDPFFKGFGVQVPVYQQVGTTTQKVSAGTGFFVRASGYIVTNKHVVPDTNATYTVLLSSGKELPGTVIWRSPTEDLAVVKVAGGGYPTIALGDSSQLQLAESVFAVGNALGEYSNSVSAGVISGLNRTITATDAATGQDETLTGVIQTDAAINPGNSGGPLVDLAGQAVGIDVAAVQGSQSIGFALPINEVKRALAQLGI
ncbi:MAG TPA: trypsin-like peptidase domain-containing protein [Candidatus Paceibacterota bacterium]|nr:trypsin-like peptidase domain-containing protein [Candidatus Paceibacterota bacterium]